MFFPFNFEAKAETIHQLDIYMGTLYIQAIIIIADSV